MIEQIKKEIKNVLELHFNNIYDENLNFIIEEPKKVELGDISIPVFNVMKQIKKPLPEVTNEVKDVLSSLDLVSSVNILGGFVNVILNKQSLANNILNKIITEDINYGKSNYGEGKNICIDYSSPNIAKSFTIGHLRSTIIGHSLKKIYQQLGYNVIGINHLGDWGTQFGKLIVAYELWGNEEELNNNPIKELTRIYVKFHDEATLELEDRARFVFKEMENGNEKYLALWQYFKDESLKEFDRMYKKLGVEFESTKGESYYNNLMDDVVKELDDKKLLVEDNGAKVVFLGEGEIPALIKRSDGASLYMTRDLAAILYRYRTYNFDKMLYVVGNEQKLHLEQLAKLTKLMGYDFSDRIYHINFGLVLQDGKKMSTRKGKVVKLEEVLDEACNMALKQIDEKNPTLENKEDTANKIGVGAVVFNDLKNHRTLDYEFNLENMLKFEGQTGPYLQYTAVRIKSILRNNELNINNINSELFLKEHYFELIKMLAKYEETTLKAANENAPSIIAKYLLNIASLFNKFYALEKIVCDDIKNLNTNLLLIKSTLIVLESGMNLLGILPLERM